METCIVGCKLPHGLQINLPGEHKPTVLKGANSSRVLGGFGMTPGVPKAAMEDWLKAHVEFPYVRNGLVFVVDSKKDAVAQAKEKRNERTGFEALDPAKSPNGLSAEDSKTLARQRAENPDRNKIVDELDAA